MSTKSMQKDINVCMYFKDERKRLKLSQKNISDFLGMSVKQVGRWESTIAIPTDRLNQLQALGFDVTYVVSGRRSFSDEFDFTIQKRAIDLVAKYIQRSDRELAHPEMFYPVAMEIYHIIKQAEDEHKEVDPVELGAKVISLFAA